MGLGVENMVGKSHGKSRRITPWDAEEELTPTQRFLQTHYRGHYMARHPKLNETGEAELINSFVPAHCPHCNSEQFRKRGLTANGVHKDTPAYAAKHSFPQQIQSLTDVKYL